jgi:hypothetical protein
MINETDALSDAILVLQDRRNKELLVLREQFQITYESLRPINLIKSTFKDITTSAGIKNNIVGNVIGIGTGFLSKKILVGSSNNPLKKIFGTLVQFATANVVSNHSDGIRKIGEKLFNRFIKNRKESKEKYEGHDNEHFQIN